MPFDGLESYRALVLNGDFRPLTVNPLTTWDWQEAVKAVRADRVRVVAEYPRVVRSPREEMRLPSVIALKEYQRQDRPAALTRLNVFIRDGMNCQYCGRHCVTDELTFDHVLPRSRGGASVWENLASACSDCNARKGNRTPPEARMPLLQKMYRPTREQINALAMRIPIRRENIEKSWRDFLYWESEIEP